MLEVGKFDGHQKGDKWTDSCSFHGYGIRMKCACIGSVTAESSLSKQAFCALNLCVLEVRFEVLREETFFSFSFSLVTIALTDFVLFCFVFN